MSDDNRVGFCITNGKQYFSGDSKSTTNKLAKAGCWKKSISAENVLQSVLKSKHNKNKQFDQYYVIDISVVIKKIENDSVAVHVQEAAKKNTKEKQTPKKEELIVIPDTKVTHGAKATKNQKTDFETIEKIIGKLSEIAELSAKLNSENVEGQDAVESYLNTRLAYYDQEALDLMHKIELTNFSASEGYALCAELQKSRQERRKIKDLIMKYEKIGKLFAVQDFDSFQSEMKMLDERLENRTYHPRVRPELFDN